MQKKDRFSLKNTTRLLAILVLALVAAGVWFWWSPLQPPVQFSSDESPLESSTISSGFISEIQSLTKSRNIDSNLLHSNPDALLLLDKETLLDLKTDLASKNAVAVSRSEKDLVAVYERFLIAVIELKELDRLSEKVKFVYDLCDQKADVSEFNTQLEKTNEALKSLGDKTAAFSSSFGVEAQSIGLYPFQGNFQAAYNENLELTAENESALRLCG